ncbi:MAG TPA: ribbon-helix-helix domain-containing protein [Methylocystis sp.]|nr:ribbon-helix-helix domain-containing protein [Methylocystis sp.]
MATVTISLPESLKKFVDEQLAEKGYGNISEYFRGLLRDAQAKDGAPAWRRCCSKGSQAANRYRLIKNFGRS